MEVKYEFAGIGCNNKRAPKFDVLYDSDGMYFASSRKTYEHVDDEFNFKYKYCIKVDSEEDYDDPGVYKCHEVKLLMVILPECLCDSVEKQIGDSCGHSWEDEIAVDIMSITDYGPCPIVGSDIVYTAGELRHAIASAKRVIDMSDAMRGFYLDRSINMLGTTGWDIIRWWLGFQEDWLNRNWTSKVEEDCMEKGMTV